jgi:hypothetical protein
VPGAGSTAATGAPSSSKKVQAAASSKKKSGLKAKGRGKGEGPVLGGADYVELMMGGRRKARQEAEKLPTS